MIPPGIMPRALHDTTDVGSIIRSRRRALGLRQEDLALAAGTGRRLISEMERGKGTAEVAAVLRVLQALGLSLAVQDDSGSE